MQPQPKFHGAGRSPGGDAQRFRSVPRRALQVDVHGEDFQASQQDICIAGFGWVGVGLRGSTVLRVWSPRGIAVTRRAALLPDFAKDFERPGWSQNCKALFKDFVDDVDTAAKGSKRERDTGKGRTTGKEGTRGRDRRGVRRAV
jgi:hypothetical protein